MTSQRASAWLVATLLTLGGVATVTPARAQDACDGVSVVVDPAGLGGEITTRCAQGDPDSGLEALRGAGHSYTFVPRQPGLVCTIDARPDPCNGAPQDAYWSYWHAEAGGTWTYSTRGAGNRDPAPGTAEGWAFGAGDPPRRPPPAAAPAEQDPARDEPADDEPVGNGPGREPGTPAPDADPDSTAGGTARTGEAHDATAADAAAPTSSASPVPLPTASASPTELDTPPGPVAPATASPTPAPVGDEVTTGGGGAPVGLLAGGLLISGLAGAALVRARARHDG